MAQLGKYDILEELGRGGFGIVYKARDRSLDRLVALKVLHPQLTVDPSFLERFRKEARDLARINHPNAVTIHDIGEIEGRIYIAMEYLPGGSLVEKLGEGQLSPEDALKVTSEVAAGLGAGHEEGLVHRDVKPGNILFNKRGEAVIADFGLAKALRKSSSYIKSSLGRAVGTPYYRAPELWKGKPPPSPSTDIYSLGCVLFEMITGEVLFQGDTEEELITKHLLEDALVLMDACQVQVPARIQEVLEKALAKDPSQRYQGMTAFLQALSPKQEKQQAVLEETTSKVPGLAVQRTAAQVEPDRVYKPSSQRDGEASISKPVSNETHVKREKAAVTGGKKAGFPKWLAWGAIGLVGVILTGIWIANLGGGNHPTAPQPDVNFEGISFSFDDEIASGVKSNVTEIFDPVTYQEDYIGYEFSFENYLLPNTKGYIWVFSTDQFPDDSWSWEIFDELNQILIHKPIDGSFPFLPFDNGENIFVSKISYLDFKNGNGIRYLAERGNGISLINNLTYIFTGITNDGRYFLSAKLPVTHELFDESQQDLIYHLYVYKDINNWEDFISERAKWVDAQDDKSFYSNLEKLDEIMASFEISR